MLTFMQALPSVLATGKVKVVSLVSYHDGYFLEFEIIDEEGSVYLGARLISFRAMFSNPSDLVDELWYTPHMVYK